MPSCFSLFNSSSTSILLNNSTSPSCLYLCALLYTSFSFVILCSFLIALSTLILLWILELQKHSHLLTTNENNFQRLPHSSFSLNFPLVTFIFLLAHHLLINAWSLKLIWPITISLCVPCTFTCKHFMSPLKKWMFQIPFSN